MLGLIRNIFSGLFCLVALLIVNIKGLAQDIQLTQFYSAPCFLNPALAGDESCARLTTNFRKQWPAAGNGYASTLVSYDSYVHKVHGGLGFLYYRDVAGTSKFTTTSFSGIYNYQVQIDRNWEACFATQVGGVTKIINYRDLIFGDQIARGGASTTIEAIPQRANYLDISSGLMVYSHDMWYGLSVHHLNTPNESMLGTNARVPMKFSLQGGETFNIGGKNGDIRGTDMSFTIAVNYKHQDKFDQLDVGGYFNKSNFVAGVWYRGIPGFLKSYKPGYPNNDALCFLIGYISDRFRVGYSYDQTISWLIGNTRGAHEVSFSYQFCAYTKFKPKKRFVVSCPKF